MSAVQEKCSLKEAYSMDREFISVMSIEEAVRSAGPDTAYYGGGTEIERLGSGVAQKKLILLNHIPELYGIRQQAGEVRIGAMTTFSQALKDPAAPAYLKEALLFCGSFQKRNMATIGGNIAAWRSDSYLVPTLLAADALLEIADASGIRQIDAADYANEEIRSSNALITAVVLPDEGDSLHVLSKRYANTVESHAYLTIAMGRMDDTYHIGLAVKGCGIYTPDIRNWSLAWREAGVQDDMFGSEAYKKYLTGVTLDDMYEKLSQEGGDWR